MAADGHLGMTTARNSCISWAFLLCLYHGTTHNTMYHVLILQAFENLKKKAKKAAATDKLEKLKTGGGTYVVTVATQMRKSYLYLGTGRHH